MCFFHGISATEHVNNYTWASIKYFLYLICSAYTWHPCWSTFGPSQLQVQLFSNLSDQPMLCCKRSLLPWWCIQCTFYLILFATTLTSKDAEGQDFGWNVADGKDPSGSYSACQHQRCWKPCLNIVNKKTLDAKWVQVSTTCTASLSANQSILKVCQNDINKKYAQIGKSSFDKNTDLRPQASPSAPRGHLWMISHCHWHIYYNPMEWRTKVLWAGSLIAFILSSTYVVFEKKFGNSSTSLLLSRNRLGKITCNDKVSKAFNIFFNVRLPSVPWNSIPLTERLVINRIQSNNGKPVL